MPSRCSKERARTYCGQVRGCGRVFAECRYFERDGRMRETVTAGGVNLNSINNCNITFRSEWVSYRLVMFEAKLEWCWELCSLSVHGCTPFLLGGQRSISHVSHAPSCKIHPP